MNELKEGGLYKKVNRVGWCDFIYRPGSTGSKSYDVEPDEMVMILELTTHALFAKVLYKQSVGSMPKVWLADEAQYKLVA